MTLTPYLAVADAAAAISFYAEVFGAVPRGDPAGHRWTVQTAAP